VPTEKIGTEKSMARTKRMTFLVVRSASFLPTFDSSGTFISSSSLSGIRLGITLRRLTELSPSSPSFGDYPIYSAGIS